MSRPSRIPKTIRPGVPPGFMGAQSGRRKAKRPSLGLSQAEGELSHWLTLRPAPSRRGGRLILRVQTVELGAIGLDLRLDPPRRFRSARFSRPTKWEVSCSPVKVRVSFPVKIEPRINLISLCRPAPFRFRNLFRLPQSPPAEPSRKITPDVSKGQQRYNVSYGSVSRAGLRRKLPCCSRRADGQKWAPS
jgi:hypothetical protein